RHLHKDTKAIIFLSANESYSSLYRLYIDTIRELSDYNLSHMCFYSKYWSANEIESKIKQWNYYFEWAQHERIFY
ncbi:25125_t:CDS:2, partial [Cetraspora pellucida]